MAGRFSFKQFLEVPEGRTPLPIRVPPGTQRAALRARTFNRLAYLLPVAVGTMVFTNVLQVREGARTGTGAAALALAGLLYAALQFRLRPAPAVLAQRLLLAGAFLGWAIVPFIAGRRGELLGNLVIALYVLDMYWMMRNQLNETAG